MSNMVPDLEALLSHLASPAGNQGLSSAPVQEAALPLPLPLASSSSLSPSLASLPPPFPPSRNPPPLPPAIPLPPPPPTPPLEPRLTRARTNGGARQSLREGSISDGDDGSDFHDDENDDDERAEKASGWAKARKTRWTPQEDAELVRLVRIKPALTWTEIGEQMPGRKASGCMMRWYNFIREDGGGAEGSPDREDAKAGDDAAGEVVKQREKKARGGGASASVESKKRVVSKLPDGSFPSVLASPSSNPNPNPDPHSPSWAVPTPSTPSTSAAASAADGPLSKGVVRGRRTHSPGQLEGQLKTPSGKPMKVHSCPAEGCEAAFKRSEHLKRHYRSVHLGAKPFACEDPKCPKSFSRKDNLRQHMKMVHQLESPPWHRYVPPGAGASSKKNSNLSNTSSEDPNLTLIAGLLNAAAAGELDVDAEGEEVDAEGEVDGASALDHQALQAALNGNGKRDAPESERPLAGEVLEPEAKRPRITRPDEQHGTGGVQADLVVDPSLDPSLVDVEVRGGARAHYDDEDDSVGVVGLKELEGQLEL